jgi:uncharacterized protein
VILFMDSSALVKLYVLEPETDAVLKAVRKAKGVAISSLALPETTRALHRRAEENIITHAESNAAFKQLLSDLPMFDSVPVDDFIGTRASLLIRSKGLKGADAVHLASVAYLSHERRGVQFMTFDEQLENAAQGVVRVWEMPA